MSLRRRLSWSSALQGLQNDRTRLPAGVVCAKSLTVAYSRIRKVSLVTTTGAYDRAAIMSLATATAKAHQERTGEAWGACMGVALKGAWLAAKDARHRAAH